MTNNVEQFDDRDQSSQDMSETKTSDAENSHISVESILLEIIKKQDEQNNNLVELQKTIRSRSFYIAFFLFLILILLGVLASTLMDSKTLMREIIMMMRDMRVY